MYLCEIKSLSLAVVSLIKRPNFAETCVNMHCIDLIIVIGRGIESLMFV